MGLVVYIVMVLVGLLATLVGLLGVAGSLLPVEHQSSITIELKADREQVWHTLTERAGFTGWMPGVTAIEELGANSLGQQQFRMHQGHNSFVLTETVRTEPTQLVRTIADDNKMFSGEWNHTLEAGPASTKLMIMEKGRIPGAIPRAIMRYFVGFDYTLKQVTTALKKKVENP